jgi:hypothetical protein
MKYLVFILIISFEMSTGFAAALMKITGKVSKIENREAVIQTANGEARVQMNKVTKEDARAINEAIASKKQITLMLPQQSLKK